MTADNRDIAFRDIIADAIHETYDSGCVHEPQQSGWTGMYEAVPCVSAAQDALTALGEQNIHVVRDEAANDGHDHVVMFVDARVRDSLRAMLMRPDMRGIGYSDFISRAMALWDHHDADSHPGDCPKTMLR